MIKKIVNIVRRKLLRKSGSELSGKEVSKDGSQLNPAELKRTSPKYPSGSARKGSSGKSAPKQGKYRRKKPPKTRAEKTWDVSKFDVVPLEGKSRFHDFDLPVSIMRAIYELGFSYCTPVQEKTLAGALDGADTIGQAQTGTGKTAAFLITIIARLMKRTSGGKKRSSDPFALIIAPTRELVTQISKDASALAKFSGVQVASVFGGMDYEKQQRILENKKPGIIVATPGRLLDFLRKKIVSLKSLEVLVIDEADRMLDMGFIPDVRNIVYQTPPKEKRQTLMFSATLTPEVRHLASQWCIKPVQVEVEPEQVAVDTIEQRVYLTTVTEKYHILYNMIHGQKLDKVLVFANRKDQTRKLAERLTRNGIGCEMLSGDVAQKKRMSTLERFRSGRTKVLVATDVAGRGIHVDDISHVFNYTLPFEADDYVHRIGRTGRAGKQGVAISFADEEGGYYLPEIEEYIGYKLQCVQPEESLLKPAPKGKFIPKEANSPRRKTTKKPYYKKRRRPTSAPKQKAKPGASQSG